MAVEGSAARFRRCAAVFRATVADPETRDRHELARAVVRALSDVYHAALRLPELDWDAPELDRSVRRSFTRLDAIERVLGQDDTYREVWHPYDRDGPIDVSVAQQLAEIYDDLDAAEALLAEHGPTRAALHELAVDFEHWGKHAVDVLRPLHVLAYGPPA